VVNQISKTDVVDGEFLDQEELGSDGSFVYLTTTAVSTTSGTRIVVVDLPADGQGILLGRDHPAQTGDFVTITGTSGGLGNGTFSIDVVLTDNSFSVLGSIGTSAGGSIDFHYRAGAELIGLDPTGLAHVTSHNVQGAIEQLDAVVGTGTGTGTGISEAEHKSLRQLIHLADEGGPFEGFTTGAVQETLPSATPFPTSIVWWTDAAKTAKILEEAVTYNSNSTIATDNWKVYDVDGSTLMAEITDAITYSGVFELSRVRTIVDHFAGSLATVTIESHKTLRQLVHLAEEGGPYEGFSSGAYQETLPAASPFPTSVTWWTSAAKVSRIVEETVTYNPNSTIATDRWKVYAPDGTSVLVTVTDTMTYSGVFELSRVRAIT
jgi:hypothetical protein